METPSAKDREISVRHGGDLAPVKLLAGNAFTLAYVTDRIKQKIPAFDSTFKLCYNDPSGTEKEDYTLNTDEDLKEAFMKFDVVSPPMKAKFVTMKKAASGPLPAQPSELDMRIKALEEREKALEIREKELNSRNANVAHSQITAPSPVKSTVSRDRISSNRSDTAPSRAWWDSNVSHMPLSTAVITASPWIGQTHTRFLRELFAAIDKPADTIKKYPLPASDTALGWTALEKRLGPKILALQGRNEASWQSEVANPLFKEPLHEFFNNQEEYLYLLADPSLHFRADLAVAQRIIDTTADPKLPAYENWRVQWESVKMASTCVAPWLQLEVKRDHGDVRAEIKCKLAMQLLVAREYQEKIVDKLVKLRGSKEEKLEHRTHLQFPWAIGALLDDKGVEFIYMSAEHEDSRRCVYTDLLTWDKLQSIFAVIAVLRVYAHLFWDELLTYVHALVRIPGQPPARRSPSSLSSGSPDSTAFAPFLARPSVPVMFAAHSSKSSSGFAHSPERKRVRAMPPQVTLSSDLTAMEGRVCTCTVGADQVCVKLFDQGLGGAQEWRILASLRDRCSAEKSHHFVQLVGWTQLNGRFALVTRRVVCRTRHFRCSSLQEMLCYGASLCEALGELHRLNIIHGDVKPSNALWDVEEGCVKLIDFGNAVFGPEWHGDIGGTDGFRAPESGSRATFATDVYSAGRTLGLVFSDYNEALLDLIASSASFESWLQRAARRSIRVPASLLQSAEASQAFTVIHCMLAADPKQRPVAEKCAKSLHKILRRLH